MKGTWREGTLKGMQKRLWRRASIAIGAPLGNLGGGSSTGDFERWMKGALGKECLSVKRLTVEGLEGGLIYWGPWVMKGRLWVWASLFVGAQLGNLEWARLPGTSRDDSLWELCEGNLEGELLAGDPGVEVKEALETGISFHRGTTGEPGRGSSTRDFERQMKGALGMERFSLKRLSAEGLCGGLLY